MLKNIAFVFVLVVVTAFVISILPDGSGTPNAWLSIVRSVYGG
jgi:hypothetical protein